MIHKELCSNTYGITLEYTELLREENTQFQNIKLIKSKNMGLVLLIDDIIQLIETKEFQYHEPITYFPLLALKKPQNVLVIGGGDMGVLKYAIDFKDIENIDFVELDEKVIEFSKDYLKSVYGGVLFDKRIHTHIVDGRVYVGQKQKEYDAIIMDMTDPYGPSKFLYTKEFFNLVKNALKDDGLFCMHTLSPDLRPELFGAINHTLRSVFPAVRNAFNYVMMYGGLWSYAICGNSDIKNMGIKNVEDRINKNNLNPKIIDSQGYFSYLHTPVYIKEILNNNKTLIQDNVPLQI